MAGPYQCNLCCRIAVNSYRCQLHWSASRNAAGPARRPVPDPAGISAARAAHHTAENPGVRQRRSRQSRARRRNHPLGAQSAGMASRPLYRRRVRGRLRAVDSGRASACHAPRLRRQRLPARRRIVSRRGAWGRDLQDRARCCATAIRSTAACASSHCRISTNTSTGGNKTLWSYSAAFDLRRVDAALWVTCERACTEVHDRLVDIRHYPLISKRQKSCCCHAATASSKRQGRLCIPETAVAVTGSAIAKSSDPGSPAGPPQGGLPPGWRGNSQSTALRARDTPAATSPPPGRTPSVIAIQLPTTAARDRCRGISSSS